MSFRTRILAAFVGLVVAARGAVALGVRHEMETRLAEQHDRRVEALVDIVRGDLARETGWLRRRLGVLGEQMADDNRLRRALVDPGGADRRYLLDYAGRAMRTAGLDVLQIQDASGRVLSSGHFRNEYGESRAGLSTALRHAPEGRALAEIPRAEGPMLALVTADSLRLGPRRYWIVGGVSARHRLLARLEREEGPRVALRSPGGGASGPPDGEIVAEVAVPYLTAAPAAAGAATPVDGARSPPTPRRRAATAHLVLTRSRAPLEALESGVTAWLLGTLTAVLAAAVLLGWWLSARLSRPLEALATRAGRMDWDRLDVDFGTDRTDELGRLSRVLATMTERLRAGAARLRDAERRATIGEIARQVNHDIRNGLAPLRHALRHLGEVADRTPTELPRAFSDRRESLDDGLSYLEELAGQYGSISGRSELRPCDLNEAARGAVEAAVPEPGDVALRLSDRLPPVLADPLALRRVVENLVRNGLEAVDGEGNGRVTVRTETRDGIVRLTVADDGPGIPEEEQDRIFEDFYTTREDGTGLGLSIVRRLVADLDGQLRVESRPGEGAAFVVDLPAAGGAETPGSEGDGSRGGGEAGEAAG